MPGCINGPADRQTENRSSDTTQSVVAGTRAHRRERAEIISQILAILEDVAEVSPEDVNENSVLMDDLDLSSMEILTIVADLEETFGLRIPEKELRNFVTIGDLVDYLAANAG